MNSKVNAGLLSGIRRREGIFEIMQDRPTHYYPMTDKTGIASGALGTTTFRNVTNPLKPISRSSAGWAFETVDSQIGNCLEGAAVDTGMSPDDSFGYCCEGWFKVENPNQGSKGVFGTYNGGGWMIYTPGAIAGVNWYHGGNNAQYDLTRIWLPNVWVHLAILWDGKSIVYHIVNGVILGQTTAIAATGASTHFCIGTYNNDLNTAFTGLRTCHVAYWNSLNFTAANMNPEKVAKHYAAVKGQIVDRRIRTLY